MVDSLLAEIEEGKATLSAEAIAEIVASFRGMESPVAAARIHGAEQAIVVLRAELSALFEAELESIGREPHERRQQRV